MTTWEAAYEAAYVYAESEGCYPGTCETFAHWYADQSHGWAEAAPTLGSALVQFLAQG